MDEFRLNDQVYGETRLLEEALRAGIRCEQVVVAQENLDTLDPTLPEEEQIQTVNLFQKNEVAFGFKRHDIGELGRGICWIPVNIQALESTGVQLVFRTCRDVVNQKLDELYAMVEPVGGPTETVPVQTTKGTTMDGVGTDAAQESTAAGDVAPSGDAQVEQPAQNEGEQQSGEPAESTKTDGQQQDGGGTGSNDGVEPDSPEHEANQTTEPGSE